jgi:hypothetical protein
MNFKLALAAAAVVGLAGTAQAADLAKKAPAAANYVKICDAYGAGYFYIPGSETCLKIGGYVRAEVRTGNAGGVYYNNGTLGGAPLYATVSGINQSQRALNGVYTRARANINFDARTATEFGLLRSYIEVWLTNSSGNTGNIPATLRQAFVQFGGLTAGRAQSFFDFIEGGYNIGNIEPDSADHRVNLLGYTFSFGNGISASVAIEDQSTTDFAVATYGNNGVAVAAGGAPAFTYNYQGVKYPDLVANVAIAQAWGKAQIMGALHSNYGVLGSGVTTDKWGYAVGAGVEVNLPMIGAGDKAFLQGIYTKGAVGYAIINGVNTLTFGAPAGAPPTANIVNFNADANSNAAGTAAEQTTAWSISGGLNHNFSKIWEANLGASYAKVDNAGVLANVDYSQYIVGADLRWKPVSGFYVGLAADYIQRDFSSAANAVGFKDNGAWLGTLRVQRSF